MDRLYFISSDTAKGTHVIQVQKALSAGVRLVQVRSKLADKAERKLIIEQCVAICREHTATCIVNDDVELAKLCGCDGVHLGKSDMPPLKAREILGANSIIGGTANTANDCERLIGEGVNYIGLGPYRFTLSKDNLSPVLGEVGLRSIVMAAQSEKCPPLYAIGGIEVADVSLIFSTGIYGVAVGSAISHAESIVESAKSFLHECTLVEAEKAHEREGRIHG